MGRRKPNSGPLAVADENRLRLMHGPYMSPAVRVGQVLRCRIRGDVTVARFSDGPIPWPRARNDSSGGRGSGPYIVCGDLVDAIRRESSQAIQHWWGVSGTTVNRWRRELGIEPFNEGTRRLWSCWRPAKLPLPSPDPLVAFSPARLRARRLALGLTLRQVAAAGGWTSPNTYGQWEEGRRTRVTTTTLTKLALILECHVADLTEPSADRAGQTEQE